VAVAARSFAQSDEPAASPTPAETRSPWDAKVAFGELRTVPAKYRVVALPVRPTPRPPVPASKDGASNEEWLRAQRQVQASDQNYAQVLDAFFEDMADHSWHFVSFVDGESIALFEQRIEAD